VRHCLFISVKLCLRSECFWVHSVSWKSAMPRPGTFLLAALAVTAIDMFTFTDSNDYRSTIKQDAVGGTHDYHATPGFCARYLYLVQCAEERPTFELSSGPNSAALMLVYRKPPRSTCHPVLDGQDEFPRPESHVEPASAGGGNEPAAHVWGDCTPGGSLLPPYTMPNHRCFVMPSELAHFRPHTTRS
jgi:hypothetical protein